MTKLFQEAVQKASTELSQQDQDRFARFLLDNIGKLHDLIDDLLDEYTFEKHASTALETESVQRLLQRVAEKYQAQHA